MKTNKNIRLIENTTALAKLNKTKIYKYYILRNIKVY
jgi:hypothetical protein